MFGFSEGKRVSRNNKFFYKSFTGKLHCVSPPKLSA